MAGLMGGDRGDDMGSDVVEAGRRPRWLVVGFILLQVVIPTVGLVLRLTGGPVLSKFGWHMFSALG